MTLTVESWCEALESGKYKQTTHSLRKGDGFCCLGVACDLSGAGEWDGDCFFVADLPEEEVLPEEIKEQLGFSTDMGHFDFNDLPFSLRHELAPYRSTVADCLALLNDGGACFPLIAKVIRARPKGLFRDDAPSAP
jgi:hypothetical protein